MNLEEKYTKRHQLACERKENTYLDPVTGFYVLTAFYLEKRGSCCGAGCRHCPYPAEDQYRAGRREISNPPKNPDVPLSLLPPKPPTG